MKPDKKRLQCIAAIIADKVTRPIKNKFINTMSDSSDNLKALYIAAEIAAERAIDHYAKYSDPYTAYRAFYLQAYNAAYQQISTVWHEEKESNNE